MRPSLGRAAILGVLAASLTAAPASPQEADLDARWTALVAGTGDEDHEVLDELAAHGREALAPLLDVEPAGLGRRERELHLGLLERCGRSPDLARCVRLATVEDLPPEEAEPLWSALERAAGGILGRSIPALRPLPDLIVAADEPVALALIRATDTADPRLALDALTAALGHGDALDARLLPQIARLAHGRPFVVDALDRARVRGCLDSPHPPAVREAALVVGVLEDFAATERLVELLVDGDRGQRANALWGLRRLTGLRFEQPERWRRWLAAERAWYERRSPRLLAELRADDPARWAAALGELVGHRYRRDELARDVAAALDTGPPERRRVACLALAQLGSAFALPALIDQLSAGDPAVVRAAWSGLRDITGADLPPDPNAWRDEFPSALP